MTCLVAFARLVVALAVVGHAGDVAGVPVDVVVDALDAAVGELDKVRAVGAVALAGLGVAELGAGSAAVASALSAAVAAAVALSGGACLPGELVVGLYGFKKRILTLRFQFIMSHVSPLIFIYKTV